MSKYESLKFLDNKSSHILDDIEKPARYGSEIENSPELKNIFRLIKFDFAELIDKSNADTTINDINIFT